jgi:hypothetical protein
MTRVASSPSQYCRRSLPEISTLFPTLMKVEMPTWRCRARASMARPNAPLWDSIATLPLGGRVGDTEALSRTAGSVFKRPMELGPTTRIPWPRAFSRSFSCRARPSAPASANPAVTTMSARTPAAAQSSTASSTASRDATMMARSVPCGISRAEG